MLRRKSGHKSRFMDIRGNIWTGEPISGQRCCIRQNPGSHLDLGAACIQLRANWCTNMIVSKPYMDSILNLLIRPFAISQLWYLHCDISTVLLRVTPCAMLRMAKLSFRRALKNWQFCSKHTPHIPLVGTLCKQMRHKYARQNGALHGEPREGNPKTFKPDTPPHINA